MLSLGYDIGSSSIKGAIIDIESGELIGQGFYPGEEMKINSTSPGFAEQDPGMWWDYIKILTRKILKDSNIDGSKIKCIGISYQMHGLVIVDEDKKLLRPSIIWCDSRAVNYGKSAFDNLGREYCLQHLLNSPGNFTASKLKWIKENEPGIYKKIFKIMLPGEFIAMKLTDSITTTISGLSEGIFWDFKNNSVSKELLSYYGLNEEFLAEIKPTFSVQGQIVKSIAEELGINNEAVVSYRAGDQPNSLNKLFAAVTIVPALAPCPVSSPFYKSLSFDNINC